MIITIDGPAAAGKGTLAVALAQKYHLAYFDTGMVYRATGLQMLLNNEDPNDGPAALKHAMALTFPQMMALSQNKEFRSSQNGQYASIVSAFPAVRAALLKMQQDFAKNPVFADGSKASGAVYDGRDTGTVICPQADIKFFLTATLEVRAGRRFKEFQEKGFDTPYETVYNDIKARDERDSSRKDAPLKPADDAIVLDSTEWTIERMVEEGCKIVERRKLAEIATSL